MRIFIISILVISLVCINSYAQRRRGRHESPSPSIKLPQRIDIENSTALPQEIVFGVGTVTVFHLPEPVYKVLFGNKEGIDYAEPNEALNRSEIYVRATAPNISTNMILEFPSGILILNVRTVDKKGGVRPGDYHVQVFIKPYAIGKNSKNQSSEKSEVKNEDIQRQIAELQIAFKKAQEDLVQTREILAEERKNKNSSNIEAPNNIVTEDSKKSKSHTRNLEKSIKERDETIKQNAIKIAQLEKLIMELRFTSDKEKNSINESGVLRKDISRLESELANKNQIIAAADLRMFKMQGELERKNTGNLSNGAEGEFDSLNDSLNVLEEIMSGARFQLQTVKNRDGILFTQIGKLTTDQNGRFWVGVYLKNNDRRDLALLSISDSYRKDSKIFWPSRFIGKKGSILRYNEESYFFVVLQPSVKTYKPSAIDFSFSSNRNLKLGIE